MKSNIYRFKYLRTDEIKFVSHLDLVHVFERALRRANLPVGFSNGFNPRMLLVFGNPLPVGLSSNSEYVDIEFTEVVDGESVMDILNSQLPRAIKILEFEPLFKPYDNIVKAFSKAEYQVKIESNCIDEFVSKASKLLMSNEPIEAVKKSKNGDKLVDIRPMIYDFKYENDSIVLVVSCGQEQNLKAELAISTLLEKTGFEGEILSILKTKSL